MLRLDHFLPERGKRGGTEAWPDDDLSAGIKLEMRKGYEVGQKSEDEEESSPNVKDG